MTDQPTRQPNHPPRRRQRWVLLSLLLLVALAALMTFFSAGVARSMTCERAPATPAGDGLARRRLGGRRGRGQLRRRSAAASASPTTTAAAGSASPPPAAPPPPPPPPPAFMQRRRRSLRTRGLPGAGRASLWGKQATSAKRRTIERPRSEWPTATSRRSTKTPTSAVPPTTRSRRSIPGAGRTSERHGLIPRRPVVGAGFRLLLRSRRGGGAAPGSD